MKAIINFRENKTLCKKRKCTLHGSSMNNNYTVIIWIHISPSSIWKNTNCYKIYEKDEKKEVCAWG